MFGGRNESAFNAGDQIFVFLVQGIEDHDVKIKRSVFEVVCSCARVDAAAPMGKFLMKMKVDQVGGFFKMRQDVFFLFFEGSIPRQGWWNEPVFIGVEIFVVILCVDFGKGFDFVCPFLGFQDNLSVDALWFEGELFRIDACDRIGAFFVLCKDEGGLRCLDINKIDLAF